MPRRTLSAQHERGERRDYFASPRTSRKWSERPERVAPGRQCGCMCGSGRSQTVLERHVESRARRRQVTGHMEVVDVGEGDTNKLHTTTRATTKGHTAGVGSGRHKRRSDGAAQRREHRTRTYADKHCLRTTRGMTVHGRRRRCRRRRAQVSSNKRGRTTRVRYIFAYIRHHTG